MFSLSLFPLIILPIHSSILLIPGKQLLVSQTSLLVFFLFIRFCSNIFFLFPWNSERHIVVTKKLVIILKTENSGCGISGKNNNNSSVNIKFNILLPGFESLQIYWVYLCIFFFHPILPCIPYLTNLVSCIFFSREHSSI